MKIKKAQKVIERFLYARTNVSTRLSGKFSKNIEYGEIKIYYSKHKCFQKILFILIGLTILYLIAKFGSNQNFVLVNNIRIPIELLFGILFIILSISSILKYFDSSPKLIINNKGINIKREFLNWSLIESIYVQNLIGENTNIMHRILVETNSKDYRLWADDLTLEVDEISHILHLYKSKYGNT